MSLPPLSRATALCVVLASASCVIGNDKYPRPRDLSEVWFVDRTRILAIRADPPEVTPGQNATFSALVARPETTEPSDDVSLWLACSDEEGSGFGCDLSALTGIDPANADLTALQEAGLIGFEPFLSPSYTPESALLDGLEGQDRLEGVYVTIAMSIFPASVFEDAADQALDFNEVESAYKRLVVSEATTPNNNPTIVSFVVAGTAVPAGAIVEVDPNQPYELSVLFSANTVETYQFVNSEGRVEERVEEPYVGWFATGGTLFEEVTLFPYLEATWVSPEVSGTEGTWWAVVRDRRGGQAWITQRWRVR